MPLRTLSVSQAHKPDQVVNSFNANLNINKLASLLSSRVWRARPHTRAQANHFKTTRLYQERENRVDSQGGITVEHSVKLGLTEELNPHGASMGELQ